MLFHTIPNYKILSVFSLTCWPNLCPYNRHKIDLHFHLSVFMGYSNDHKGYCCLHLPTGRAYISLDVIFDETIFPFSTQHRPNGSPSLPQTNIPILSLPNFPAQITTPSAPVNSCSNSPTRPLSSRLTNSSIRPSNSAHNP